MNEEVDYSVFNVADRTLVSTDWTKCHATKDTVIPSDLWVGSGFSGNYVQFIHNLLRGSCCQSWVLRSPEGQESLWSVLRPDTLTFQ